MTLSAALLLNALRLPKVVEHGYIRLLYSVLQTPAVHHLLAATAPTCMPQQGMFGVTRLLIQGQITALD